MHEVLGMGAAKAVNRWRQQALAVRALPAPDAPLFCHIISGDCNILPESLLCSTLKLSSSILPHRLGRQTRR